MNLHVESIIVRNMLEIADDFGYTPYRVTKVYQITDLDDFFPDTIEDIFDRVFYHKPMYVIRFNHDDPNKNDLKMFLEPHAGLNVVVRPFESVNKDADLIYDKLAEKLYDKG